MHYYKRNLGDYSKKAGRLSILQHGVYNLLLDACYDREKFPTREEAIDWTWAASKEELEAVDLVLRKFFEEDENGVFIQSRIKEELEAYWKRCGQNRKNRSSENNDESLENDGDLFSSGEGNDENSNATINHKPLTTNQEPKNKNNKARPKDAKEVTDYAKSIGFMLDGQKFIDHYEANGWMRGKTKIKDWKACVRTWKVRQAEQTSVQHQNHGNDYNYWRIKGAEIGCHPLSDESDKDYCKRAETLYTQAQQRGEVA